MGQAAAASRRGRVQRGLAIGAGGIAIGKAGRADRAFTIAAVRACEQRIGGAAPRIAARSAVGGGAQGGLAAGIAGAIGVARIAATLRHAFAGLAREECIGEVTRGSAAAAVVEVALQIYAGEV